MARIRLQAFPAQYTPIPFEYFNLLAKQKEQKAEKEENKLNLVDEAVGKFKGNLAALQAAPGHEGLAKKVEEEYKSNLMNWQLKYQNDFTSRQARLDLINLNTAFASDQRVKDIVESKNFYTQYGPKIWDEQSKGSLIVAPNIMDDQGNFLPNSLPYNTSTIQFRPQGDYNKAYQEQINIFKEAKYQKEQLVPLKDPNTNTVLTDANNHPIYDKVQTSRVWNNEEHRKELVESVFNLVWNDATTDPRLRYHRELVKRKFPGDEKAQQDEIRRVILNSGIPFNFDHTTEQHDLVGVPGDKSDSNKPPKAVEQRGNINVITSVGQDYIVDANGDRVLTDDALVKLSEDYDRQAAVLEGTIINEFEQLIDQTDPNDRKLKKDALIEDADGYRIINTNLLTDPYDIQNAESRNAELRFLQIKASSARYIKAYFAENAGFKGTITDKTGQVKPASVEQELEATNPGIAKKAVDESLNLLKNHVTFKKYFPEQALIPDVNFKKRNPYTPLYKAPLVPNTLYRASDNFSFILNRPISTTEDMIEHIQGAEAKQNNGLIWEEQPMQDLRQALMDRKEEVYSQDPRYAKYAKAISNHLKNTIYTNVANYAIVEPNDKRRIQDLLPFALAERKIERSKFDAPTGDTGQEVSPELKEKIAKDLLEKTKDQNYDYSNISIRTDPSKGDLVLDVILPEGRFEVRGFDQEGLLEIVKQQDSKFSGIYLSKKSSLISQLDASNGTYALMDIPIKNADNSIKSNDRIVVKAALENHGEITRGSYLFTIEEIPGRVFSSKTDWGLISFMDTYKEFKQAGYTGEELKNALINYTASDGSTINFTEFYKIDSYQDKYNGIGSKYFPTEKSKVNKIAYPQSTINDPRYEKLLSILNRVEASDYTTLFNQAELKEDKFKGFDVTTKTLKELYEFTATGGDYDNYTRKTRDPDDPNSQPKATPLGKFQIVGDTLKRVAKALNLPDDIKFSREIQEKMFLFLLNERLARGKSKAEKREQLRAEWEGLINVSDSEIDEALNSLM